VVSVIALGVTGYGIAILFTAYRAPDLALTQFLVETLAAILFLAVLARLPQFEVRVDATGRAAAAGFSILVGAAAFALVALTTGPASTLVTDFYAQQSYLAAHGKNVVNVILADFRAIDTLGEVTVLAVAPLGVAALLRHTREGDL
jgi:multicomponent Na+:H+ antiporter subunit A